MPQASFVPLRWTRRSEKDMARRALEFRLEADRRRTVRQFSDRPVPRAIIEDCIRAAGTAPSGAHRQPWRFVAVSDPAVKRRIRVAAEAEETEFYERRAPADWLEALAPLGTDASKPFLETAPWLIVVFAESVGEADDGSPRKNYYVQESVGIATGILISAVHRAGLASLTHTPSPMKFLGSLLGRPARERPFLILVVGHPAEKALVPELTRKPLEDFATFIQSGWLVPPRGSNMMEASSNVASAAGSSSAAGPPSGARTREAIVRPDRARVLVEGLVTGFLGYAVIVLFFGALNVVAGRPFFHTAELLGSGLVATADAEGSGAAGAVLAFNGLHLLAFLVIGFVAAWLVMQSERNPSFFVLALFIGLGGLFLTLAGFVSASEMIEEGLALWSVIVANLVAGLAMGAYLLKAHPRLWGELRDHLDPETEHPTPH